MKDVTHTHTIPSMPNSRTVHSAKKKTMAPFDMHATACRRIIAEDSKLHDGPEDRELVQGITRARETPTKTNGARWIEHQQLKGYKWLSFSCDDDYLRNKLKLRKDVRDNVWATWREQNPSNPLRVPQVVVACYLLTLKNFTPDEFCTIKYCAFKDRPIEEWPRCPHVLRDCLCPIPNAVNAERATRLAVQKMIYGKQFTTASQISSQLVLVESSVAIRPAPALSFASRPAYTGRANQHAQASESANHTSRMSNASRSTLTESQNVESNGGFPVNLQSRRYQLERSVKGGEQRVQVTSHFGGEDTVDPKDMAALLNIGILTAGANRVTHEYLCSHKSWSRKIGLTKVKQIRESVNCLRRERYSKMEDVFQL